ncbi:hypothetical protein U0030_12095 [Brevundimonas bullata]|uniref:hypothetical protein n=1 Tax=Brevundimonas bullata TaxID=13160 RepID=UPI0013B433EB|nr:hypothetical protein [Brevundimonas bullata]WQE36009.1 hypothetical protein U0030_12095 [Brevundimonas bullata]
MYQAKIIKRGIVIMRSLLCALSAAMLSFPMMAESQVPEAQTDLFTGGDTIFRSLPQEIDATAELIARRGAPLFTRTIIPLRSVTIESDISVRVNLGRQNIPAGSILFAAGDVRRGIYCAPARSAGWG